MAIWFVYRTHYEGVLSKRVRRVKAPSVLAWFQRKLVEAKKSAKPGNVANAELGGRVYGLGTIFEAAKKEKLDPPKTIASLRAMLEEHLYVEGSIHLDAHTLRVSTDDDEVALAYFFFDDTAAKRNAARIAYLLHEDAKLPPAKGKGGKFKSPVPVASLEPAAVGEGLAPSERRRRRTYVCLLTFCDSDSLPGSAHVFEGVRLPELAAHLRSVVPHSEVATWSKDFMETWPLEMRLLRAMVGGGDDDVVAGLTKCATYPTLGVGATNHSHLGVGAHAKAAAEFAAAAKAHKFDGTAKKTVLHASPHAVLFSPHQTKAFGHQQWILFDDVWASSNANLAASILRYAAQRDPFGEGEDE
jgi:hypothetical protein